MRLIAALAFSLFIFPVYSQDHSAFEQARQEGFDSQRAFSGRLVEAMIQFSTELESHPEDQKLGREILDTFSLVPRTATPAALEFALERMREMAELGREKPRFAHAIELLSLIYLSDFMWEYSKHVFEWFPGMEGSKVFSLAVKALELPGLQSLDRSNSRYLVSLRESISFPRWSREKADALWQRALNPFVEAARDFGSDAEDVVRLSRLELPPSESWTAWYYKGLQGLSVYLFRRGASAEQIESYLVRIRNLDFEGADQFREGEMSRLRNELAEPFRKMILLREYLNFSLPHWDQPETFRILINLASIVGQFDGRPGSLEDSILKLVKTTHEAPAPVAKGARDLSLKVWGRLAQVYRDFQAKADLSLEDRLAFQELPALMIQSADHLPSAQNAVDFVLAGRPFAHLYEEVLRTNLRSAGSAEGFIRIFNATRVPTPSVERIRVIMLDLYLRDFFKLQPNYGEVLGLVKLLPGADVQDMSSVHNRIEDQIKSVESLSYPLSRFLLELREDGKSLRTYRAIEEELTRVITMELEKGHTLMDRGFGEVATVLENAGKLRNLRGSFLVGRYHRPLGERITRAVRSFVESCR